MEIIFDKVRTGYSREDVLHEISFSHRAGRSLSIIGPNGSGKTTLLRVLAGIQPYAGSLTVGGRELSSMRRKEAARLFSMVPQFTELYFSYSVKDTVLLGRYVHSRGLSFPTARDTEVCEKYMDMVDILDLADKPLDSLSGGQRQRVFLARAMVQEAPIILLDEPTNHLDIKYQEQLMDLLREWSRETPAPPPAPNAGGSAAKSRHRAGSREADSGTAAIPHTVISVFHDLSTAMQMGGDVLLLKDGRILAAGPWEETISREILTEAYGTDITKEMLGRLRSWERIAGK